MKVIQITYSHKWNDLKFQHKPVRVTLAIDGKLLLWDADDVLIMKAVKTLQTKHPKLRVVLSNVNEEGPSKPASATKSA